MGIWKSATAATALLMLQAAGPEHNDAYRRVVEDFATQPGAAVERMLALPSADVARAVRDAARADAGWTAEALNRALLMHGDAIVGLGDNRSGEVGAQIALADELAGAAARLPGNAWFVHRWYKAFTSRVPAGVVESHWRQQEWYRAAAAVDRARELEADGGHATMRADLEIYDPLAFRHAVPLFEQGVAGHLPVAALHLGRIQMLRGHDTEARRLFETAENDQASRVNRYLAYLFLGSMDERDGNAFGAERKYRAAVATLPHAQSGRLALAAVLARVNRSDEARAALVDDRASPAYDPWWSYFHATARDSAFIFAELHAEVCR